MGKGVSVVCASQMTALAFQVLDCWLQCGAPCARMALGYSVLISRHSCHGTGIILLRLSYAVTAGVIALLHLALPEQIQLHVHDPAMARALFPPGPQECVLPSLSWAPPNIKPGRVSKI